MKKLALILILALPFVAAAADEGNATITPVTPITADNLGWTVPESRGLLLEVSGDSLCYEEQWMHLLPGGGALTSKSDESIDLSAIKAPCMVDISYGEMSGRIYIIKMRILSEQLQRDNNGDLVKPAQTYE
jgi:hypothetical protein